MDSFMMMFSLQELIIAGAVLIVVILAFIIGSAVSSGKKKRELQLAEEEADMYCNLFYSRLAKEAEAKYKAFEARGYHDRLPSPVDAIKKEKEMQLALDKADSVKARMKIQEDYLPDIFLSLTRCKIEGMEDFPKKEATQLRNMMREYGIKPVNKAPVPQN